MSEELEIWKLGSQANMMAEPGEVGGNKVDEAQISCQEPLGVGGWRGWMLEELAVEVLGELAVEKLDTQANKMAEPGEVGRNGFWGKLRTGQRVSRLGPRRRRDGGRGVRVVAGSWKRVPKSFFSGRKILAEFPPFLKGGNFSKSRRK